MRAGAVRMAFTFVILRGESFGVATVSGVAAPARMARPLPNASPASAAPRESWLRKIRRFMLNFAVICFFVAAEVTRLFFARRNDEPRYLGCYEHLPIHHRAVVHVIRFAVAPVVVDFVGQRLFVQFNAETRAGRNVDVAVTDLERFLDVARAEAG